jgi:hypothetical protein
MKFPIDTPDLISGEIASNPAFNISESPIALNEPIVPHSPADFDPTLYEFGIAPTHEQEPCAVQPAPPHKQNMNIPYESRCLRRDENQQYDPLTRRQNADFIRGNLFSDRYKTQYDEYSVEMPKIALPTNTVVVDSYFYPFPDFSYRFQDKYKTYPRDERFLQTKPEYTSPYLVVNAPFLTSEVATNNIVGTGGLGVKKAGYSTFNTVNTRGTPTVDIAGNLYNSIRHNPVHGYGNGSKLEEGFNGGLNTGIEGSIKASNIGFLVIVLVFALIFLWMKKKKNIF